MQNYQEVVLSRIRPSPFNPRKSLDEKKLQELAASIREKGVLEPILLRPFDGTSMPMTDERSFEIVAGERRYRAMCRIAEENGGLDGHTIPAIVRELSDDEAFEVMTIENLCREDLTELEEARGFQMYLEKKGEDALPYLAEKTGINPRYIRRRTAVLKLPDYCLSAWEKGKIVYGHLEQLLRLSDDQEIERFFERINASPWNGPMTVQQLSAAIDHDTPDIKEAPFDIKAAGCPACQSNSTVQKKLFDIDARKALCLNRKCFKQHVNNHLLSTWKSRKTGTQGFRFDSDVSYSARNGFYGNRKPAPECKKCQLFVSLVNIYGKIGEKQLCIGDSKCFDKIGKAEKESGAGGSGKTGPRVSWHGSYFRDKFYQVKLFERMNSIDPDDERIDRLALYHLLRDDYTVLDQFIDRKGLAEQFGTHYARPEIVWRYVESLDRETIRNCIRELAILLAGNKENTESVRGLVAAHIGIELAKEFSMDEEYLQKKTRAELVSIGEKLQIFKDPKVEAYLFEKLLKKRGKYTSCKKSELVKLFLESGVDLTGKVPDEILGESERTDGAAGAAVGLES
ncbi:MAG: ParB/RepB/Spo0J family partition protein [Desulfobacteraceae bacterium]|nr:MAG: ParB/RepB/Spo0J family partition protein [Desulfobacteraceae bacterium]